VFLRGRLDVRLSKVPKGKDPADFLLSDGPAAFSTVLTSGITALEFKWNQLLGRYQDGASGPDRRRAIEEFLGLLSEATEAANADPIQRGLVVNQVGKLLGLPPEEVYRQLGLLARRKRPATDSAPVADSTTFRVRAAVKTQTDAAAGATQQLLEVLLNAPSYYAAIENRFDPGCFKDPELLAIGEAVKSWATSPCALPDLIASFESASMAALVTELQLRGECRGNYEAQVQGALATLDRVRRMNQGERTNHFAARRHLAVPRNVDAGPGVAPVIS
jgi:DNA primase